MPKAPSHITERLTTIARGLGIDELHEAQIEAIEAVLAGRDTLLVAASGFGKSAVYQIAGALLDGPTVVVSPLIALQRDQAETIAEADLGDAALLNSLLPVGSQLESLEQVRDGQVEFLLLAPEQLIRPEVLETVRDAKPSLFVLDEAHCISTWGGDFRPEYHRLGAIIDELGHPIVLALTATASSLVRSEIEERLGMQQRKVIVHGFDRPNIHLAVQRFDDDSEKRSALTETVVRAVAEGRAPGIVYVATRARTEELAEELAAQVRCAPYHGGLARSVRDATHEAFMRGELEVLIATSAFGMGVDKPDVRFVFHFDIPESLDEYYQEIGRAGRDGHPAQAILFYRSADVGLRRFFASTQEFDAQVVEALVENLREAGGLELGELAEQVGLGERQLLIALNRLQELGVVDLSGTSVRIADRTPAVDVTEDLNSLEDHRRAVQRSRVEMMQAYAELRSCRRAFLLHYLGDRAANQCAGCDNCDAGVEPTGEAGPLANAVAMGDLVEHDRFGAGEVLEVSSGRALVLFGDVGYKTLDLELAGPALRVRESEASSLRESPR